MVADGVRRFQQWYRSASQRAAWVSGVPRINPVPAVAIDLSNSLACCGPLLLVDGRLRARCCGLVAARRLTRLVAYSEASALCLSRLAGRRRWQHWVLLSPGAWRNSSGTAEPVPPAHPPGPFHYAGGMSSWSYTAVHQSLSLPLRSKMHVSKPVTLQVASPRSTALDHTWQNMSSQRCSPMGSSLMMLASWALAVLPLPPTCAAGAGP